MRAAEREAMRQMREEELRKESQLADPDTIVARHCQTVMLAAARPVLRSTSSSASTRCSSSRQATLAKAEICASQSTASTSSSPATRTR